MRDANHSIFRADSIKRYAQSREQASLPRFGSPRTFAFLWSLIGIFLAGAIFAWFAQMPVFATGQGIAMEWNGESIGVDDDVVVFVFLPSEHLPSLRVGQPIALLDSEGGRLFSAIVEVEPEIISPMDAHERFNLSDGQPLMIKRPAVVVVARLNPIPRNLSASKFAGSMYRADVEIGSRRVVSLVPVIGRLFGEQL